MQDNRTVTRAARNRNNVVKISVIRVNILALCNSYGESSLRICAVAKLTYLVVAPSVSLCSVIIVIIVLIALFGRASYKRRSILRAACYSNYVIENLSRFFNVIFRVCRCV